ncbi:CheY-like chemotaxis protein [Pseudomonas frederiksbergensis]|uniref:ATP-binding protein n=1 Tax=Pseudomonas frederiksbergensis TaxID=104087 RepID=UPI003D2355B5
MSIINNLLDFSRIEAGQLELSYEQTAIFSMLDRALLTINLGGQEKGLELRTQVAANVPRSMSVDGVRVQQILINLLANAVKFTAQGGVYVWVERRAEMMAIAVQDTGNGIPEDNQLDIFMPFIQVRAHDNGSGMGLAIASRLASLMGAEILLSSQVGVGSTFTMLLPIRDPDGPSLVFSARLPVPVPVALQPQLSIWGIETQPGDSPLLDMPELVYLPGRLWQKISAILFEEKFVGEKLISIARCPWILKVLIVDDLQINRDIVRKMLHALGHHSYSASSGEEALSLGRAHVFDWVLVDIRMPDMEGLQVTRLWRDMSKGILDPDTPIMALTASTLPVDRHKARAVGMNGYLVKPLSLEQLARKGGKSCLCNWRVGSTWRRTASCSNRSSTLPTGFCAPTFMRRSRCFIRVLKCRGAIRKSRVC